MRNGMPEIFAFCAKLRAIENRVTVVRSSNAGITGFWSPTGDPYGLVKNSKGKTQSELGCPEVPLIESLIRFREKNEKSLRKDPALQNELNNRIQEIETMRTRASVEGWSTQPILLYSEATIFQRFGDWFTPLSLAVLIWMNLLGFKVKNGRGSTNS